MGDRKRMQAVVKFKGVQKKQSAVLTETIFN